MKIKSSIIISSIAACAIFASAFAFNGFAIGNTQAESTAPNAVTAVNTVKDIASQQLLNTVATDKNKAAQNASVQKNDQSSSNASKTTALKTNTTSNKASQNTSCPTQPKSQTTNQQTNIKSADITNKLQTVTNSTNCNKTTAKTYDYSALKSQLESLLNCNKTTTKPSAGTPTTSKPTTSKPTTSTPSKPASNVPSSGDYSAFQKKVVELVNAERAKNGLKPLTMNTELSKVATLKSQDMAKLNYFDHNSPTYGSPFDMMKKYGISYRTAGENIAMGQTSPEQVMQGWMNSPGHRANILNSSFTQIGVGIAKNSSGRLYWTQQFIG